MNLDSLAITTRVVHAVTCVVCVVHALMARARRHATAAASRGVAAPVPDARLRDALAGYLVAWFVADRIRGRVLDALSAAGPGPFTGLAERVLLGVDRGLYLAWIAGLLALVGFLFTRTRTIARLAAVFWLVATSVVVGFYPALRGAVFFQFVGVLHLLAVVAEVGIVAAWWRKLARPTSEHRAAIALVLFSALPAIAFVQPEPEVRAAYLAWSEQGLLAGFVLVNITIGGALWVSFSKFR